MNQCIVPNWNEWNVRHQGREQVEGEEGENRPSHVHNPTSVVPMSNYEVKELTWENGQLAMHELGGILPTAPTKVTPTWGRAGDTLESIVHQATSHNQNLNLGLNARNPINISSNVASRSGKLGKSSGNVQIDTSFGKKRMRLAESDQSEKNLSSSIEKVSLDRSACASASATFCMDNDTTMMTWASFESPRSFKTQTTNEDQTCRGGSETHEEECKMKGEIIRSHSTRRSRAAAIHNQSERRRRDRINEKMQALQMLVPNASKTDKASMLDEVIEYLKQLQAQVQMMSSVSINMPQMMMPLGIMQQQQQQQQQQHIQMSMLARMGMGMGMAPQSIPQLPTFIPPPFMAPPMIQRHTPTSQAALLNPAAANSSASFNDPYCALLAQSMNIDFYNKMAALYRQEVNQATESTMNPSQPNHVQEK